MQLIIFTVVMIHLSVMYKKSNVYKRLNPFEQSEHRDNEIISTTNPPLLHAMFLITNAENFITANSIMEKFFINIHNKLKFYLNRELPIATEQFFSH